MTGGPPSPPPRGARPATLPPAGLCDTCRHQRVVVTTRGSAFSLCALSRTDERFRRYPPLPVLTCPGYKARPAGTAAPPATGT